MLRPKPLSPLLPQTSSEPGRSCLLLLATPASWPWTFNLPDSLPTNKEGKGWIKDIVALHKTLYDQWRKWMFLFIVELYIIFCEWSVQQCTATFFFHISANMPCECLWICCINHSVDRKQKAPVGFMIRHCHSDWQDITYRIRDGQTGKRMKGYSDKLLLLIIN